MFWKMYQFFCPPSIIDWLTRENPDLLYGDIQEDNMHEDDYLRKTYIWVSFMYIVNESADNKAEAFSDARLVRRGIDKMLGYIRRVHSPVILFCGTGIVLETPLGRDFTAPGKEDEEFSLMIALYIFYQFLLNKFLFNYVMMSYDHNNR